MLCATLLTTLSGPTTHAQVQLPTLSDPVNQTLSPERERALGEDIMRRLRVQLPLLQDTWSNAYMNQLGQRLVNTLDEPQRYQFFIVDDPQLNAFALPGGFIGINAGMIAAADTESQLLSVVAHEIAHVQQRHIARAYTSQSNASVATLAGVIASLLLASANPSAGQAALTSTLAYSYQSQINFTRENEYEADRMGLQILRRAGYDTQAMSEMFAIMLKRNRLNTSEGLEFLRTHPLTNHRVAEAQRLDGSGIKAPSKPKEQADFLLFQARIKAMSQKGAQLPATAKLVDAYFQAQKAVQKGQIRKAEQAFRKISFSDHPLTLLLKAEILSNSEKLEQANALFQELEAIYPDNFSYVESHAKALAQHGQWRRALNLVEHYLQDHPAPNPAAYRQAAELAGKGGARLSAMEYQAEYYIALKEYARAREQLATAIDNLPNQGNRRSRLQAKLDALKPELERLAKE